MVAINSFFYSAVMMLTLFSFFTVLNSCSSSKLPKVEVENFSYTEKDMHDAEIKRIRELLPVKTVEAFWRAVLLGDQDEIDFCVNYLRDVCFTAIEQKDYFRARFMHKSLVAAGFGDVAEKIISEAELNSIYSDNIPGIGKSVTGEKKNSTGAEKKVSEYIDGTVTIWVDLGIKVQHGMGFANRVIGSGFFIDKRGYIVTNHHVIADLVDKKSEGYGKVYIKLAQDPDTRIPAKVVGWDSVHDLALLKTEIDPPYVFNLGSSTDLDVGDKIYAIGSPLGLERTLTSGIVSATDRKLFTTGSVMQIDAAVNSGNSGGPCIDENGNVQAIVFAGMPQFAGLNFAIPVEYLKQDLPMLYAGGERFFPWIGAYGHTAKSGNRPYGLEVQYFIPGSAMARTGVEKGSVITSMDGKPVKTLEDVQDVLRDYVPETILKCGYINPDGENKECLLYLTERPKNPGYVVYQGDTIQNSFIPLFGISMNPASTTNSRTFVITKVLPGSSADESGFSENDPVTVGRIQFNPEKTAMYVEFVTKRRRKGYLDISMGLAAPLDSPYYF